ncbi:MAG: hypothetical protein ACJ71U_23230 [Terriglobales bacterium]
MDGESIRGQEWSLAKALKAVRPTLPIILLEEHQRFTTALPESVDAVIPITAREELLKRIEEMLSPRRPEHGLRGM